MYVVEPMFPWWGGEKWQGGKRVAAEFKYTSDLNTDWLGAEDLARMAGIDPPSKK